MQSLTNVDFMSGEDGTLNVGALIPDDYTGSAEEIARIAENVDSWHEMYDDVILSNDAHGTMLTIKFVGGLNAEQKQSTLSAIRAAVLAEIDGTSLEATFVGDPVMSENSKNLIEGDLMTLIPLVAVVLLLCLFFSFRTVDGMVLPLITVLMAACWSVGLMAVTGATFTIASSVIPVALIAVGSAYGIHVLNHYYIALKKWGDEHPNVPLTKEIHRDIVCAGLHSVKLPILLAGFTTVAGFFSLVTSPLSPLKTFAVFSSFGVASSLLLAVLFIPAALMLKSPKKIRIKKTNERGESGSRLGKPLFALYTAVAGTKIRAALFVAVLVALSVIGLRQLRIETAFISYFPKNGDLRRDVDFIDAHYAGTNSLYLIVDGHEKGALTRSEILLPLEELQQRLEEKFPQIGKCVSFTTFLKKMNEVMHEDGTVVEPVETITDNANAFDFAGDFDFGDEFDFGSDFDFGDLVTEESPETTTTTDAITDTTDYSGESFYEVPATPAKYGLHTTADLANLVSQYLLLYSGSLDDFIDNQLEPSKAKVVIQMRERSSILTSQVLAEVNAFAAERFPAGYTVEATGIPEIELSMTNMIVSSQITSLAFSLVCVLIILSVSFRSVWAGLVGCVPLALTILLNYMVMGLCGISLDMFTSLIASLAVGIGIDYTIHFMTGYRENRRRSADLAEVTRRTMQESGKGIITNALSVGLAFLILCFSNFVVLRYIGLLVAEVMFTSSLLAMTVIPAILNAFDPKFTRK